MDLQLTGKTAVVTGATAGIGMAIARTLVREGAAVTLTGRYPAKLQSAVAEITKAAPAAQVSTVVADLGSAEGAAALVAARPDIDILINNLGLPRSQGLRRHH